MDQTAKPKKDAPCGASGKWMLVRSAVGVVLVGALLLGHGVVLNAARCAPHPFVVKPHQAVRATLAANWTCVIMRDQVEIIVVGHGTQFLAVNSPRSFLANRASDPLTLISRIIAA